MSVRRFNWKLLIIIFIGLGVLTITALGLRTWQKNRMAIGRLSSGNRAYAAGQWEQAVTDLGKYIAVAGGRDVSVLLKYADAQLNIRPLKKDNIRQAISTYRSILQVQPDNRQAATKLIQLYLETDMHSEAELIARNQLQKIHDPNIHRMLAEALIEQRKFQEASAQLVAVIDVRPDDIASYEMLSRLCQQRPEEFSKDAKYWLDEAVRKNPLSAMAYIVRGAYEFRNKNIDEAAADFEYAQKLDLSNTDVRLMLARELINADQLALAKKHLEAVQVSQPGNTALWQTWAMLASKSGSKAEMVRIAEDGLENLAASNLDFMPIAAALFIDGTDYVNAAKCLETLARHGFDPGSIAFLKGMLSERQAQVYQAVKFYREALESGNRDSRVRLALAKLLFYLGDERAAIKQMRLLVSEQPYFDDAKIYLATLLIQDDMAEEAAQLTTSMLQNSPNNAEAKTIYVIAQMKLLGTNSPDNSKIVQIEKNIDELETLAKDKISTKLLKFRFALQCSNINEAQQILSELKKNAPENSETAAAQIDLLLAQNQFSEAKIQLDRMVKTFGHSPAMLRYSAIMLDSMGLHEDSQSVLIMAVNEVKDISEQRQLTLLRARQLGRAGKFNQACELLDGLDNKFENDIAVKKELLKFDSVANDFARAQGIIDEIRDFEGQQGTTWRYEQARIWFHRNDFTTHIAEIVSLLNYNLNADPEDNDSRLLLAMTYDKAGLRNQAMAAYHDALNRSPRDLRVIIPAVAALFKSGEYDEADKIMKVAAQQNISHPILSSYELQNCLRQGQLESAAEILEDLRIADPNNDALDLYFVYVEMRRNNFIQANNVLMKLKARRPDSPAVLAATVELNIRRNKAGEAIALCDEAIEKTESAQAYILRGRIYQMLGNTQLAQQDFEYAASIEPNNPQAWAAMAQFCTIRGLNKEAAIGWQKCAALSPDNTYIREQALTFFFGTVDRNMNSRGEKMLKEALAANPNDQRLQIWQARALLLNKTVPATDKAIEILAKAAQSPSTDVDVWSLLCQAWLEKNEPAKALDVVLRGLVFLPENKTLLLLKARSEAAHTPELAIPTMKLLYEKDSNDADVAIYLANLYVHTSDYKAALAILTNQLSRCEPNTCRKINIMRAVTLYKSGDKVQASKLFETLANADPNDAAVMMAKTDILKNEQKWDALAEHLKKWHQNHPGDTKTVVTVIKTLPANNNAAAAEISQKILRNALAVDPDSIELLSELAMVLQISGNSAEAAALYNKLIELDPENLQAINNLAWIMCEDQGKHMQALELAEKGLRISPDYLDLVDTRGMAYFRLGKFDKAIEDFSVCAKMYPSNVPSAAASYFHLGRAFAASERKDEAARYINMAIELNQKIGGLSTNDVAQARDLLDRLLKGVKL